MKHHNLLLLLVLIAITFFAMLNWGVFITPTELSLGFSTVHLPLGLVMLALLALVSLLFLMYVVYLQVSVLVETRRQSRESRANRELADQAESSRYAELRTFLDAELAKLTQLNEEAKDELLARINQLNVELRTLVEQTGNSLAASIGEMEDRLDK
jgi:uncharacterized integral membrane protein